MGGSSSDHWADVYSGQSVDKVSWFQSTASGSLEALTRAEVPNTASLIDVGGGASTLASDLLALGWTDLSVMDISADAIAAAKTGLGGRAKDVAWSVGDVTAWRPDRQYDVWHDRAVFHFLVTAEDQAAYLEGLQSALSPGGVLIVATFAPDGPKRCSGLPVVRYDVSDLERAFSPAFVLIDSFQEDHPTPTGAVQPFTWAILRHQP